MSDTDLARLTIKLAEAKLNGDPVAEAGVQLELARVYKILGHMEMAYKRSLLALELSEKAGQRDLQAKALNWMANLHLEQCEFEPAIGLYGRSLSIARELGDRDQEAITLGNMATLLQSRGQVTEAQELWERAIVVHRETGNRSAEAHALDHLAAAHQINGDQARAHQLYAEALTLAREDGDRGHEGWTLLNLSTLLAQQGDLAEARDLLLESLGIAREVKHQRLAGIVLGDLAQVCRKLGEDPEEAAMLADKAVAALESVGDVMEVSRMLTERGHAELAAGRSGRVYLERARKLLVGRSLEDTHEVLSLIEVLNSSVEAFDDGQPLVQGELPSDGTAEPAP